jgi:hypothetical protein
MAYVEFYLLSLKLLSTKIVLEKDFDREASKKVNNQLKEIEAILYENNSYRPVQIEYKEWLEKFPHLRFQACLPSSFLEQNNKLFSFGT